MDHPPGTVPLDEGDAASEELPRLTVPATQQPDALRVSRVAAQVAQRGGKHGPGTVAKLELLDGLVGNALTD